MLRRIPRPRVAEAVVRSCVETLEERRLFANPTLTGTTLYIDGTTGNDVIGCAVKGTQLRVVINGVGSKFSTSAVTRVEIQGYDGTDHIDVSASNINTYINAGTGNDFLAGGSGRDTLTGGAGKDTIIGNAGNDRLNGNGSPDIITGGDGDDAIYGGAGGDAIHGNNGNDHLWGDDGIDTMWGDDGNDSIVSVDGGVDYIAGGTGRNLSYTDDTGVDKFSQIRTNTPMHYTPPTDSGGGTTGGGGTGSDPSSGSTGPISTSAHPLSITFNDEALWDENFTTSVNQMKSLGVKAVRLYVSINSYADRPTASDNIDEADIVSSWNGNAHPLIAGLAIKRAFDLKAAGFTVLMTVNVVTGQPPTSAQQVTDFYSALMNSTKGGGSSTKLKDVVDYWEVGNEVDLSQYWAPSGANKTNGIKQFVDEVLIPASAALHSGATSNWEQVVSPSVSWSPADVQTILNELTAQNKINAIDEIGFHPYGRYNPDQNIDEISGHTNQIVAIGNAVNKPVIATEWNVRGYNANGSQNASWSAAITQVYNNIIKPNFLAAFYFGVANDYAARGGDVSATARPAGLLKHDYSGSISPSSSVSDLLAYYQSPLVTSDPFYSMYDSLT